MNRATNASTPAPEDEPGNTDIDGISALESMAGASVILTGRGVARCSSSLAGIRSITDVLLQLECDKESIGGIQASTRTTTGLLQALAVCAEFVTGHINEGGITDLFAQSVSVESPVYSELKALHERKRRGTAAAA